MGSNSSVPVTDKPNQTAVGVIPSECPMHMKENDSAVATGEKHSSEDQHVQPKTPPSGCPMHEANFQKGLPSGCTMRDSSISSAEAIDPTNMV